MTLDSRPSLVLLSGICALIVSLGIARFAYTPKLPFMQGQAGVADGLAGWLAGWNYLGYLSGVLVASRLKDLILKDRLYRIGLLLTVVGLLYPAHPAQIMAKLTLGYSVSQISGPIIAGEAAEASGTFNGSLMLAGVLMVLGLMCLQFMFRYDTVRVQPGATKQSP